MLATATPLKPQTDVVIEFIDAEEMADADQHLEQDEAHSRAALQQYMNRMLLFQESATPLDPEWLTSRTAAEIEATKMKLRSMRPPGRKLEGLRGVVARGEKRVANVHLRFEAAEQEVLEARSGLTEESQHLEENRAALQSLVNELATNAQLFQTVSPAQLPPEIASLNQQIASLN